ncbi:MAG TPA: hypothetical protein VGN72_16705 [Tepidisphaeraceae bacterium]|jgi:hypothetical protein|nr:hypothetical protein [Tepidisphaeraceae bacterium]
MESVNRFGGSDIILETGPETVRCFGRPRNAMAVAVGLGVLAMTVVPVIKSAKPMIARAIGGRGFREDDVTFLTIALLPFVLVLIVLTLVYRRRRMRRGFEIVNGIVTLYTPDSAIGQHVLERSQLAGAELVRSAGGVDFRVLRRNGQPIPVLIGYAADVVGPAVDAVNRLVVDDRVAGFEVIPLARFAPPTAAPADDPPL